MDGSPASALLFAAFVALVAWRAYGRVRSLVGRQRLRRARPWITVTIFPLALAGFAWATATTHADRLSWLALGVLAGTALAFLGLRRTDFEVAPDGLYFTPHAHIGIVLAALLVGRIVYRLVEIAWFGLDHGHGAQDFVRTPATLAIIGLLGGYFATYSAGLLRWRFRARSGRA